MKSEYKFGEIMIKPSRVGRGGAWQTFTLDVSAPGLGPFMFQSTYINPTTDYEAAEKLVFSLRDIWADPSGYIARRVDSGYLVDARSEEERRTNVAQAEADAKRTVQIVGLLDPFIPGADEALWKQRGRPGEFPLERKGPREWKPKKGKN